MPPAANDTPVMMECCVHGDRGYVVRWPDGTSAWWLRRWQALAACAGWKPPMNGAYQVPHEPFHYEHGGWA